MAGRELLGRFQVVSIAALTRSFPYEVLSISVMYLDWRLAIPHYVRGVDSNGGQVLGAYDASLGTWAVLDPGIVIDQFYTFNFNGSNSVSGCYYQVNPPGSTNLSRCYSMFGSRSGVATMSTQGTRFDEMQLLNEVAGDALPAIVDRAVVESYLAYRKQLQQ